MHTSALFTILPIFLASGLVSAHGVLEQVTIAGKTYAGPPRGITGAAAGQTLARQVNDNGPVAGPNAPTMACGDPGKPAALDAEAMPGDSVAFKWSSSWPHVVGPMMTYMADCGGPCSNFDASQAKWFKIDQKGFKDSGEWFQADIKAGKPDVVTIPKNLKAGHYLMRNELIATHNTPAEFYPACAQVKVGGSGTGVPAANELVSFPGAYTGQEPGLGSGYSMKAVGYQFPGPPLATLAGSDAAPSSPILAADPVNNNGSPSSTPYPAGTSSSEAIPVPSQGAPVPSADAPAPSPSSEAPPAAPPANAPPAEAPPADAPTNAPPADAPVPPADAPVPPADAPVPPADAPAPPSQPSPAPGYEGHGGYEHGHGSESCRSDKRSRSRFIRSTRPTPTGAPVPEVTQDVPAEVTPEVSAPVSNVRRAVHSRVMRRMAASHSH